MSTKKEKMCRYCREHPNGKGIYPGYYFCGKIPGDNKCRYCGNELQEIILTNDEMEDIYNINPSNPDLQFLESMIELKEKDPIEFQLKMQQFRTQTAQQKQIKQQESNKTNNTSKRCPSCGGTEFTPVRRKWSLLTGFMTNKVDLVCNKCGKKIQ